MLALKLSGLNFEVEHACYIIMWGKNMETNLSKLHENKRVKTIEWRLNYRVAARS